LEDSGYIDLYFGDQSHFGLTPNVPYAWQTKENPVLLPAAKGKYQNVVGLMTRKNKLYFEVLETTFNSDRIICFMNRFVEQTVKKTIVILDNSPIHKSKKFIAKIEQWKEKDVLIYFLPPYSPELNPVERYWLHIKNNVLKNKIYKTLDELEQSIITFLRTINENEIKSICNCSYV